MNDPTILAIDPGTEESAVVLVSPGTSGRVVVRRADMVPSTLAAFATYWRELETKPVAVAVECAAGGGFDSYRVPPLLKSQWRGGTFAGFAFAHGCRVLSPSAQQWRKDVLGSLKRGQRVDEIMVRALPLFVVGAKLGNNHINDATGLAYWASVQLWRRKVA